MNIKNIDGVDPKIQKMIEDWKDGIKDVPVNSSKTDYTTNLLHEQWDPKWKWFQPPMWKIFRWAYNINGTLFTNVYPITVKNGMEIPPEGIELEFQGSIYISDAIEEKAKQFKNYIEKSENFQPMEICKECDIYPQLLFHKTMCINVQYCTKAYHFGHMDGTLGNAGLDKNRQYRGNKELMDRGI